MASKRATQALIAAATGPDFVGVPTLSLANAGSGTHNMALVHNGTMTGDHTLTLNVNNAARTLSLSGNLVLAGTLTTAGALTTVGAYGLTLTVTGATALTLPTSGTLATLAGVETLTNKTLTSPVLTTPTQKALNMAKTADYAILAADTGTTFVNAGAGGTVVFALPAAAVGLKYRFGVGAAQALRIDPNGTETISLPSTGVAGAAGKYLGCSTVGATVGLECVVAGTWAIFGSTGTWAAEA